jgi:hypothetical protein
MPQLCGCSAGSPASTAGRACHRSRQLAAHGTAYKRCDVTALEQAATAVEFLHYPLEVVPVRPSGTK